ncbi:hypothetical protein [Natrinema sp. DC36]|uniref:hypothetical protein n=1 Tax=Natrinema sp. DC36 TaxID=2878680 RepID=UPI001CF0BF51|nr:hypothetical protein [Natrinema sp. DC36]
MSTNELTDIRIDGNRDIEIGHSNDIAVVSGQANVEQSISIATSDSISKFVGSRITGTNISLLEKRVEDALEDDPQVGEVLDVTILEFDKRNDTIEIGVELVEDEDFTIEV